MKVLVAGASGAIGKALVPLLVRRGHAVGGLVRNPASATLVQDLGAEPVIADALDRSALLAAVSRYRPNAVVHQLTALPADGDYRAFDRVFEATNRLRTQGTDNLIEASRSVGVERFVAQSYCGWTFARDGGPVKSEDDPFDPHPLPALERTLRALQHVERATEDARDLGGIALRYGAFYGPGTTICRDGAIVREVRRRRLPIVGRGSGIWSFIHVDDAAAATAAALEGQQTGIFQVVDDDPAPVRDWLPELARIVGAKPPWRLPGLIARLVLPAHLVIMMTEIRGASNARFRRSFEWAPRFSSWRDGFSRGLG